MLRFGDEEKLDVPFLMREHIASDFFLFPLNELHVSEHTVFLESFGKLS